MTPLSPVGARGESYAALPTMLLPAPLVSSLLAVTLAEPSFTCWSVTVRLMPVGSWMCVVAPLVMAAPDSILASFASVSGRQARTSGSLSRERSS